MTSKRLDWLREELFGIKRDLEQLPAQSGSSSAGAQLIRRLADGGPSRQSTRRERSVTRIVREENGRSCVEETWSDVEITQQEW